MLAFNNEIVFPSLPRDWTPGGCLFDVGKGADHMEAACSLSMCHYGVGIRWLLPFGPVHIDIGFNPCPKTGEKNRVIDFHGRTVY